MLSGINKIRVVFLLVIMGAAGWLFAVEFKDQITTPSKQLATTSPTLSPLTKNIFFPLQRFAARGQYYGMFEGEFILSATTLCENKRSALLCYPLSKTTRWINEGDFVGDMVIRKITSTFIEVERFAKLFQLMVGSASSSLDVGKRIFTDSFQLVGVCKTGKTAFAIVKPANEESVYHVRVDDFIGSSSVLRINDGAIVLNYAGIDYTVPVGGMFTPEGKVQ